MGDTRKQVFDFYREVVQRLKGWQPKAPKLPDEPIEVSPLAQPEPPPFAAADQREVGKGVDLEDQLPEEKP